MSNLSIQLQTKTGCDLIAIDTTNLSSQIEGFNYTDYVSIEFIRHTYDEYPTTNIICKEFVVNRDEYAKKTTTIKIPKDGTYSYYKYYIPKLEFLVKHIDSTKYTVQINNEYFFYEGSIYKGISDLSASGTSIDDILSRYIETILPGTSGKHYSEKISNYVDISTDINATQSFKVEQTFFSACHLQMCLVTLQKKILFGPESKFCLECEVDQSIRYRRDLLLASLYVLDFLIKLKNFDEAQKVIDSLSTCNSLCGDELDNSKDDCGCGGIRY